MELGLRRLFILDWFVDAAFFFSVCGFFVGLVLL